MKESTKDTWAILVGIGRIALFALAIYYGIRGEYAHASFLLLVVVLAKPRGL